MGTLYLVATPIGNLEDITLRAIRILGEVSLVAAEDTRRTGKLLKHYNIQTMLTSFHEHNRNEKLQLILSKLDEGDVALVSDAGTPAINDPGYDLVKAAIAAGFPISPVPGPSAPIAALVASGLPPDAFLFLGYMPRKKQDRRALLDDLLEMPYTMVILETPHRLIATLSDLLEVFGNRTICVAREITKLHEEFFRGQIAEAHHYFTETIPRGEVTLVISGKPDIAEVWPERKLTTELRNAMHKDIPPSQIAAKLARQSGWKKSEVYKMLLELQSEI